MPRKSKNTKRKPTNRRTQRGNGRVSDFIKTYQRPLAISAGTGLLLASGAIPMLLNHPLKQNEFIIYDKGYPSVASTF